MRLREELGNDEPRYGAGSESEEDNVEHHGDDAQVLEALDARLPHERHRHEYAEEEHAAEAEQVQEASTRHLDERYGHERHDDHDGANHRRRVLGVLDARILEYVARVVEDGVDARVLLRQVQHNADHGGKEESARGEQAEQARLGQARLELRLVRHLGQLVAHVRVSGAQEAQRTLGLLLRVGSCEQVARTLGAKGQRGELKEREGAAHGQQQGPPLVVAEQLGQTEHLREQDRRRGAELEEQANGAANLHRRDLVDVHRTQSRVEACICFFLFNSIENQIATQINQIFSA